MSTHGKALGTHLWIVKVVWCIMVGWMVGLDGGGLAPHPTCSH